MLDRNAESVVYRLFDDAGRLLYIGAAANLPRRLQQHRRLKYWWPTVARCTSERWGSLYEARRAESVAIDLENPLHNQRRELTPISWRTWAATCRRLGYVTPSVDVPLP